MRKRTTARLLLPLTILGLFALHLNCVLIPDDTQQGDRVPNRRPEVRITQGAATPDSAGVDYKVHFRWHGTDDDGVVALYQWAVDDTVSERAWNDTTGFSAVINFLASTPVSGTDDRFHDWHTFFIRAIDNEFAISKPDRRFFNAITIAPTTKITFPDLSQVHTPQLQRTVIITWEGEDLDSSRQDKMPIFYEYKLAKIQGAFQADQALRDSLILGGNLLLDTLRVGSKKGWVRVPGSEQTLKLTDLPGGESLIFGVRAVDEAGAVEPSLDRNINFIPFAVTSSESQPFLIVNEAGLGTHNFPIDSEIWEVSVPSGKPLYFRWDGDASYYGSVPGNVNYALDIPDVENEDIRDPRGVGGWIGWGRWTGNQHPIIFSDQEGGTIHTLWVKMRDISDARSSERRAQIRMKVVPFTFNKHALIVDDAKFPATPVDAVHDPFVENVLLRRLFDLGVVDRLSIFPATPPRREETIVNPTEIPLDAFAQYQHIVWHSEYGNQRTLGLHLHEVQRGRISSYVSAGGRLFLVGGRLSGMMLGGDDGRGSFFYPKDPPGVPGVVPHFEEDSFIWKFMHYRNQIVSIPSDPNPLFKETSGLYEATSLHPAYPDLKLDPVKWDPFEEINCDSQCRYKGGITLYEGVLGRYQPIRPEAGLDSLYTIKPFGTTLCCGPITAPVVGAIIAQRYQSTQADTLNGTQQGRTVVFDFQPYFFTNEGVMDAGTSVVNWLVSGRDH